MNQGATHKKPNEPKIEAIYPYRRGMADKPKQERDGGLSLRESRPISHFTDQTIRLSTPYSAARAARLLCNTITNQTQFLHFQSNIEPRKSKISKQTQFYS